MMDLGRNLTIYTTLTVGLATTALLMICATGCANASRGVPIQGQVSFRGSPITSGALTFFPSSGRPVTAVITHGGKYSCQLPTGDYRVTVTVGVDLPAGWEEGDEVPPLNFRLSALFSSRLKTPLTATVTDGQMEPIDFALE